MKTLIASMASLFVLAGHAQAQCVYATDGGCAAAPANGSFIQPNFAAYATSAATVGGGQTWAGGPHAWSWNAAGVDYAVGYPTGTPLQDVYTATSAGMGSPGVLPAACKYTPANPKTPGSYARVYCGQSTNGDLTIQGMNFQSAYLGGDCVVLEIADNVTGGNNIKIIGNNFHNGPGCNWARNNFMVKIDGGTDNVVFNDNQVDGTYPPYSNLVNQVAMVVANGSGSFTAEYNAVLYPPQRPFATNTSMAVTFMYNYFNGVVMYAGDEHGEIDENEPATPQQLLDYAYNTVLIPNTQPTSTITAPVYCTAATATAGSFINNCVVDHNVFVINKQQGVTTPTSAAVLSVAYAQFQNVSLTNNYIDGSGAMWCATDTTGAAQNLVGNITGNLMTVTSLPVGAYISVGTTPTGQISYIVDQQSGESIAYQTPVLNQVAGIPNGAGVYTIGGKPQTVTFLKAQSQPAPIETSLTWTGNVSLLSGKAIPQAWNAACP